MHLITQISNEILFIRELKYPEKNNDDLLDTSVQYLKYKNTSMPSKLRFGVQFGHFIHETSKYDHYDGRNVSVYNHQYQFECIMPMCDTETRFHRAYHASAVCRRGSGIVHDATSQLDPCGT